MSKFCRVSVKIPSRHSSRQRRNSIKTHWNNIKIPSDSSRSIVISLHQISIKTKLKCHRNSVENHRDNVEIPSRSLCYFLASNLHWDKVEMSLKSRSTLNEIPLILFVNTKFPSRLYGDVIKTHWEHMIYCHDLWMSSTYSVKRISEMPSRPMDEIFL